MSLLALFRRKPARRAGKPETDWSEMGCGPACRHMHTLLGGCAYAAEPVGEIDEEYRWDPDSLWGYERGQTNRAERVLLGELAVLSETVTAWEAALFVFGGVGVAREASRAGRSGSLAAVRRESVPR